MYNGLCSVSILLYLMVLKPNSPGCGVRPSLMLFFLQSETQIQKEDVQRLEREQKAAMAVTCSDVKVKQPVRSLESLC